MDPNGHIYENEPEKIPAEDKARLDGYLRARAETHMKDRMEARIAVLERATEAKRIR